MDIVDSMNKALREAKGDPWEDISAEIKELHSDVQKMSSKAEGDPDELRMLVRRTLGQINALRSTRPSKLPKSKHTAGMTHLENAWRLLTQAYELAAEGGSTKKLRSMLKSAADHIEEGIGALGMG